MVLENRYRLVGNRKARILLFLGGCVLDNDNERGSRFVKDPDTFLRGYGFHYHFRDVSWVVYEKNFGPLEGVTVRFYSESANGKRAIEIRGLEQAVYDEKYYMGLNIQ